jgi:hypothetical protein
VSRLVFSPVAGVLALIAAVGTVAYYTSLATSPWEVTRLNGTPAIGDHNVTQTARLAEGQWLETDGESRARVNVGGIGQVKVEPNSRVKLVKASLTEHRLALERGRLEATIWAPPRLFFVDTPSAEAIDLGCAYTIEVDDQERGLLHVTSGWVALLLNGRESKVPAGALCATRPDVGPGTPYFEDAPAQVKDALTTLDFEGGGAKALDMVLAGVRARDTLTLYHLLARVAEPDRGRVYDRLAEYNQPPAGVTREGIERLDGEMLAAWREALEPTWLKEKKTVLRKLWKMIWS